MKEINIKATGDLTIVKNYCGITTIIQVFKENRNLSYIISGLESVIGYDLEIKLRLDISEIDRLLPEIIYNILKKKILLNDGLVTSELTGAPVLIQLRTPNHNLTEDKILARIIFSDENFLLPYDEGCQEIFKLQAI